MKTLHLYVLRQAISTLVMTVCVFAFVLLLGNILREILALLINRQASFFLIVKAIALLLPWIMAYVLPFALLTAMLLVFGRLSADNELAAIKASGISLVALVTPLLLFALLMSGICAWFNMKLTPDSRVAYKRLVLKLGLQNIDNLITEDRFIDEIPGVILYVRRKEGDILKDVSLYNLDKRTGDITSRTTAEKGRLILDKQNNKIVFELMNGRLELLTFHEVPIYEPGPGVPVTNLLSSNVLQSLITNNTARKVIGVSRYPEWHPGGDFGTTTTEPLDLPTAERLERGAKISDMSFAQLRKELAKRKEQGIGVTPVLVQMHRQIAFSFASFAFTLLAIPLGIRAHRRETSIGMALSLILVLVYYSFLILGEALQARERLNPHLIVWIPNLLFQTLGAILLWRANRKG
jgi:lipopolysaccharide export system permease protein